MQPPPSQLRTTRHTGLPARMLLVSLTDGREFRFARTFSIGRGEDCDIRIDDAEVSRKHMIVSCEGGQWSFADQSRNGVFANGKRVAAAPIAGRTTLTLGSDGPQVTLEVASPGAATRTLTRRQDDEPESETVVVDRYARRYFGGDDDDSEPVGQRTMMIRKAFEKVQRKHQRRNNVIIAVATVIALAAGGYAYYNHLQLVELRAATQDEFYAIKEKEVLIANLEERAAAGDQSALTAKQQVEAERLQQVRRNERAMNELVYGKNMTESDRLILRVTRRLGECELAAPAGYINEVKAYIRQWQSTGRFADALRRAQEYGYVQRIADELLKQQLSPDFFYLAMQESSFNPAAIGPPTRYGIAKGMWQFIPETGRRFGLKIGPLARESRPDADDDRHDWSQATVAAAKYIKEIYTTDAQASGLLVMASYNWGEHRVIDRVRELPPNPRERNFWKLIERFRIPDETYKYVFHIVAAALIGENPRAFGFDFDNPLASALQRYEASR
jgi:pSer/pThr/pTyr-binding forkhead associated (FHA) protein